MNEQKKEQLTQYLQEQIAQSSFRTQAYIFDDQNRRNPTRNCFVKLNQYLETFLSGNAEIRWVAIPGFRGVGKTTLLAQLFSNTRSQGHHKLFISVDELVHIIGSNISELLTVYEEIIGSAFERLETPVILFLDEVQYDPKWAITLKTIFDRSRKVFIFATGSAAVSLQSNPDVARRVVFEKLYPMSFSEYLKIKDNHFEIKGLSSQLRDAVFDSENAKSLYQSLSLLTPKIRQYWLGIERLEIERYLKFGTLPFALKLKNEGLVYDQIKKILDRVVTMDIAQLGQFRPEILNKIQEVLYTIASFDVLSINNLSRDLSIDRVTLSLILSTLEKTETITRIYPYGAHSSQVRKPSKYLFSSPAFRSMYYNFIGSTEFQSSYLGKLLEDTVALYFTRVFTNRGYSLTYDSAKSGADFIIGSHQNYITAEVGYGDKGTKQVSNTMSKIKSKYGLVISSSPLQLNEEENIVSLPLSYFLLL